MEESLLKVRNEKKTIQNQAPFVKNPKVYSPYKPKKPVIFTKSPPASQIENYMDSIPKSSSRK